MELEVFSKGYWEGFGNELYNYLKERTFMDSRRTIDIRKYAKNSEIYWRGQR